MDGSTSADTRDVDDTENEAGGEDTVAQESWGNAPRDILGLIIDEAKRDGQKGFRKFASLMSLTCWHWHNVINNHVVDLHARCIWQKPLERLLQRFPHVCTLKLTMAQNEALEVLPRYPRIAHLDLGEGGTFTHSGFQQIGACTNLRTLSLRRCDRLSDDRLALFRGNVLLESLDISENEQLMGSGIEVLQKMQRISFLCLKDCINLDTGSLHVLADLPCLASLDLTGIPRVDNALLEKLGNLTNLENLLLRGCGKISDLGVSHLTLLKKLNTLDLSLCSRITDTTIDTLPNLPRLTSLNLQLCCSITDLGAQNLSKLTALQYLNVGCLPVTAACLAGFSVLKSLRVLDIRGTHSGRREVKLLKSELGASQIVIYNS